jgi:hypothetical protein
MDLSLGFSHLPDIGRIVDEGKLAFRGKTGRDQGETAEFLPDEVVDDAEPVGALGVPHTGIVFQVTIVFDDREGWHGFWK